jgi:hypothetical protein
MAKGEAYRRAASNLRQGIREEMFAREKQALMDWFGRADELGAAWNVSGVLKPAKRMRPQLADTHQGHRS